ncbi:putative regulatory protein, FmdB family [Legionella massiliensis]|uniref:Putative regulatory protein, FmdB family n=1 Tax=Legionella massiliensis TaxID=1034943 RepID=A0A078KZX9_9GAMM|nr:zinc ribbon domain-containing protein [Legionella massiliensis]CDZ78416.1 putative regulatory protein, FmdB family [Legionella massiliensis]CEE14154.1 Zinc ribbon domain protein [Legionella massiliensis]
MPIYEYECTSCHHHFDLMQKISDPPTKQCPKCFEDTAKRLISAAGFQLKGSGWYATDFKNKSKPEAKNSGDSSSKSGESSSSSTSTKGEKE